jgi:hypothetical protein
MYKVYLKVRFSRCCKTSRFWWWVKQLTVNIQFRAPGSVGASSYPSRVFKGMRMEEWGGKCKRSKPRVLKVVAERTYLLVVFYHSLCNHSQVMEVKVDFNGKRYWKKVELSDSVFGIEPNNHAVYLDVKQYLLINVKERKERELK